MSFVTALEAPLSIANAIKKAARATGADFSYLLKTAARESSFDKSAKARTSSAAGLFQFIENTWLKTVKEVGDKFGLDKYTPHIFTTRSGRYYVPNEKLRAEILQLRHNPEVSAMMAGAFTQQNSSIVAEKIGREPTQGELYIAHFLGPRGAAELISLAESKPNARADRHFPRAARANKPIFYSRGRPRSVKQVYKNLVRHHAKLQATAAAPAQPQKAAETTSSTASNKPAENGISKPVVKPVQSSVPIPESTSTLVQKVSLTPNATHSEIDPVLAELGAEVEIIEPAPPPAAAAKAAQPIGLLGTKGAPIVNTGKVAALTHNNLNLQESGAAKQSTPAIGVWTTILEPAVPVKTVTEVKADQKAETKVEPAPVKQEREVRRRSTRRAPGLIEQSVTRNQVREDIRTAASSWKSPEEFWEYMSIYGN